MTDDQKRDTAPVKSGPMQQKTKAAIRADAIRERIQERLDVLHTTQDAINKKCGFSHSFLNDFMIGRKQMMTGNAMDKLATALETTRDFLLMGQRSGIAQTKVLGLPFSPIALTGGAGGDTTETTHGIGLGAISYLADQIASVSPARRADITIDSLDLGSGVITYRLAGDMIRKRGLVLDPEAFLAGSRYATSFAERQKIAILGKTVTLKDSNSFLAVMNIESRKKPE